MLELQPKKKRLTTSRILAALVLLVGFWLVLQITVQNYLSNSVYVEFILLCFLGLGFLCISYLLRVT